MVKPDIKLWGQPPLTCRTCLARTVFVPLSTTVFKGNHNLNLREMVLKCCPDLESFLTPQDKICKTCLESLMTSYWFLQTLNEAVTKLQEGPGDRLERITVEREEVDRRVFRVALKTGSCLDVSATGVVTPIIKEEPKSEDKQIKKEDEEITINNEEISEKTTSEAIKKEEAHKQPAKRESSGIYEPTPKHSCLVCAETFNTVMGLIAHKKMCHRTGPMKCRICAAEFESLEELERHDRTHNENSISKIRKSSEKKCMKCHEKFPTQAQLDEHLTDHPAIICDECGKQVKSLTALKIHQRTHKNIIPQCPDCGMQFKTNALLLSHQKTHGKLGVDCEVCNKTFADVRSLKIHSRFHEKTQCPQCDKYMSKMSFKYHFYVFHEPEKHPVCDNCGIKIARKDYFERHRIECLKHPKTTVEKPKKDKVYKCSMCDKGFKKHQNLKTHENTHHRHRGFRCPFCSLTFQNRASYIRHERIHVKVIPFRCEICFKKFVSEDKLQSHMSLHKPKDNYSCEVCSETFPQKELLEKHQQSEHSVEKTTVVVEEVQEDFEINASFNPFNGLVEVAQEPAQETMQEVDPNALECNVEEVIGDQEVYYGDEQQGVDFEALISEQVALN